MFKILRNRNKYRQLVFLLASCWVQLLVNRNGTGQLCLEEQYGDLEVLYEFQDLDKEIDKVIEILKKLEKEEEETHKYCKKDYRI